MTSAKKEHDAGWNDPPKFSYCETVGYSNSPKRNVLNKRVAFPMHYKPAAPSQLIDPTITPVFNTNLPPPPTDSVLLSSEETSGVNDDLEALPANLSNPSSPLSAIINQQSDQEGCLPELANIMENLKAVMAEKREALSLFNKLELIKKKLRIMEDAWKTNRLPDEVKRRLQELSTALKNKNRTKADQIQASLMVDYSKHCSEFMPAVRQLISVE